MRKVKNQDLQAPAIILNHLTQNLSETTMDFFLKKLCEGTNRDTDESPLEFYPRVPGGKAEKRSASCFEGADTTLTTPA